MSTKTKTTLTATTPDGTTVTRTTERKYTFVVMSRMTADAAARYADKAARLSAVVTDADRVAHADATAIVNEYEAQNPLPPFMSDAVRRAYKVRQSGAVGAAGHAKFSAKVMQHETMWRDVAWASTYALAQKAAKSKPGYEVVIVPVN